MKIGEDLGRQFKECRLRRNLSQQELGDLAGGITRQTIGELEANALRSEEETITAVCHALNVSLSIQDHNRRAADREEADRARRSTD
jgi:transcriptional regulator with XRE-family HTH domain